MTPSPAIDDGGQAGRVGFAVAAIEADVHGLAYHLDLYDAFTPQLADAHRRLRSRASPGAAVTRL